MDKTYEPNAIERRWYEHWERRGWFAASGTGRPYCIMLPPPNVTGSLHMGHAFQDTLMDCLIRFHRMRGDRTLWQCGTDHAGIATQMVVERALAESGRTRVEMGREAFTAAVWDWKRRSGDTITRQLRRLGTSMDWSRERFTLDPDVSRAVTEAFVRLHDEGLVYRGQRLVNWDPVLHTAISDLEVQATEETGQLWHIRYPLSSGQGHLVVATTRPETMLGDVAVAVHPDDDRYRRYIGEMLDLPLTGRTIPVIADEMVDKEFGSGCVKITPAHDFKDYEVGRRHGLPSINIFTADACINDQGPPAYVGLDRDEARRRIVADLEDAGLLEQTQAHKLMVPRGDRSGAVIEPYLTDQWFVRTEPLAAPAIATVEDGRIRFVPEGWAKTYFEWMRNIDDWCISRQLWWGHRIPAWYDPEDNVYVGRDEAEVRARYGIAEDVPLRQDPDVLDTWFSSALWPFSTLGWPDDTPELNTFYPTSVLCTGFDIIFFWVARMVMMGLKFMGDVPFREVYIHGLVRDQDGQKMSKSKGNILDPIDLIDGIDLAGLLAKRTAGLMQPKDAPKIEKATRRQFPQGIPAYGTDALRFTFAALATQGRDIRFDLGRIEGYRNFCNKLWNAARYVQSATAGPRLDRLTGDGGEPREYGLAERWIRTRLEYAEQAILEGFEGYRFDLAAQAIYAFVWDEYCDWYLEWSKAVLQNGRSEALRNGTRATLLEVLETVLRLCHPFMPFLTEELWQRIAPRLGIAGDSVMLAPYPEPDGARADPEAVVAFEFLQAFILGVRRIRAELDLTPGRPLKVLVHQRSKLERRWLDENRAEVMSIGRIESIEPLEGEAAPDMAVALAGATQILVPLAGLIERDKELRRLDAEIEKLVRDHARSRDKLANTDYLERAPPEVVAREHGRSAEIETAIQHLREQRRRVESLK
ncbi:MAG: valine--tRNA ligase [Gammaproteobacteria bacterium]|nr:valine--tRNA ligase [Gammaproteobacteria bacterium]